MNYQKLIKDLRRANTLTQQDVANMLGISKQSYFRYENGSRKISIETMEKLLLHYGFQMSIKKIKEGK